MTRASLVRDCQRIGVGISTFDRKRTVALSPEWLRIGLINRCYGPGMAWKFASATAADMQISRMVDCALGGLGYLLSVSQGALRHANEEREEYKRLCGLTRRRPNDEARLLRSAKHWLEICAIAQTQHAVERGMRDTGIDK